MAKKNIKETINDGLTTMEEAVKGAVKTLVDSFNNDLGDAMLDFDNKTAEVLNKLGRGRELSLQIKEAFAEATPEVIRLGGSLSDVLNIQEDIASVLNRNIIVQGESYSKLFASQKILNTDVAFLAERFANVGISFTRIGGEAEKISKFTRSIGVNTEAVSKQMLNNMEDMNKVNFVDGVDGLTRMAARAASIRINMQTTLDFAEKIYNPEGAIQMANAFQRLGAATGALLDPLRMMDLAANDPEELQKELINMTQQFVRFNEDQKRFEILPGAKRQLREIAQEIGIPYKELTKMAMGSADLQKKLSELRFPSFIMDETQKEFIANMAQMNERGEYTVTVREEKDGVLQEVTKNISQLSEQNLEQLRKQQEKATSKSIEELTVEQIGYVQAIANDLNSVAFKPIAAVASSRTVEDTFATFQKVAGLGTRPTRTKPTTPGQKTAELNVGEMRRMIDKVADFGIELSKSFIDPSNGFKDALREGKKALDMYNKTFSDYGKRYAEAIGQETERAFPGGEDESKLESLIRLSLEKMNSNTQIQQPVIPNNFDDVIQTLENMSAGIRTDGVNNQTNNQQTTSLSNFMMNTPVQPITQTTNENKNISGEIMVNVKIDAPPGVDAEILNKAIRDTNFLQKLKSGLDNVASNYGTTNRYNSPPLMIGSTS